MNEREKAEELLWQAAATIGDDLAADGVAGADGVADEELEAFRQGRLGAERQQEIEHRLLGSAALRRRLAHLAGLDPAAPAPLREQVLAAFDAELGTRRRRLLFFSPRGRTLAGLLAAAVLVLALGLLFLRPERSLPPDLRYELQASGLRELRGEPGAPERQRLRALPATRVTLELIPDRSVAAIELAVYRQREGQPARRLRLDPAWVVAKNGLVRVEAPAAGLLGAEPGSGRLYLVLGLDPAAWPETIAEDLDPAGVFGESSRLLVLPFEVALRADAFLPNP